MIRVSPGEEGRLVIILPYTPERVAKIKTVDGRRWDAALKHWTVPKTDDMPARLRNLFAGESLEFAAASPPAEPSNCGPLIERLRMAVRVRHFSRSTEKAYAGWAERFLRRQGSLPPESLGEAEIGRYLSSLASESRVSASTQNQALSALLFFSRKSWARRSASLKACSARKTPSACRSS